MVIVYGEAHTAVERERGTTVQEESLHLGSSINLVVAGERYLSLSERKELPW